MKRLVALIDGTFACRYFSNSKDPTEEHINERVHWSVMAKRTNVTAIRYSPPNLITNIRPEQVAEITNEERTLNCNKHYGIDSDTGD